MSSLRDRIERPLVGVRMMSGTENPLPVDGDGTAPRSRGAGFFCPRPVDTTAGKGACGWAS